MFYENIGVPVRSSTKYLFVFGVILLLAGMGYSVYLYNKANSPPVREESNLKQQLQRQMLTMPPNGDSARVSPDAGYIVVFTGSGFEHHIVYAGGKDCIVGNTEDPCKDGPILYQYVRDMTGKPNSATYKFVR
ncbi:MAG: hypothetical protein AAB850_01585 [Patescibacteria group bacterium]